MKPTDIVPVACKLNGIRDLSWVRWFSLSSWIFMDLRIQERFLSSIEISLGGESWIRTPRQVSICKTFTLKET